MKTLKPRSGLLALCACVLGLAAVAHAAPGDLDTTFSGDGRATASTLPHGRDIALQGSKILVVGGSTSFKITRFLSTGVVDTTFGTSGVVETTFATGTVTTVPTAIVVQSDGKFIVGGYCLDTAKGFSLARYTADGALDTTFSGDGKFSFSFSNYSDNLTALALTSTGKIVAVGYSNGDGAIARINTDGTLDTTFHGDGKRTTNHGSPTNILGYSSVVVDGNDKIIVCGGFGYHFLTARYLTNGSLDTSFDSDGIVTTVIGGSTGLDYSNAVTLDGSGNIIVAGSTSGPSTSQYNCAVVKYNSSGALVSGFGSSGIVVTSFGSSDNILSAVKVDGSGKIVAAGSYNGNFIVLRFTSSGALDTTFSGDGIASISFAATEFADSLAIQSDGKIVVGGDSDNGSTFAAVARLLGDTVSPLMANHSASQPVPSGPSA